MKLLANLASYVAGIPGGLFSPALAVGAGLGHNLAVLMPGVDPRAFVLLGMCAYLTGVTGTADLGGDLAGADRQRRSAPADPGHGADRAGRVRSGMPGADLSWVGGGVDGVGRCINRAWAGRTPFLIGSTLCSCGQSRHCDRCFADGRTWAAR